MKNLYLPTITKLELKNFSLYKRESLIEIRIPQGVFCLAGANGLGKSTFINILNYAITGIVRRPDASFSQFNSIPKFYQDSKSFAKDYFDRRIDEHHRDLACVSLEFDVKNRRYKLIRGFFENEQLRFLEICENGRVIDFGSNNTPTDLEKIYRENLAQDIGLEDFDQFVFIQSYVLTFDETHQLMFWDPSIMERVLYLFFNVDTQIAKEADQLRKEISVHESNMRNLQWDTTQIRKKIADLSDHLDSTTKDTHTYNKSDEDVLKKYNELSEKIGELLDQVGKIESEIKECDLNIADFSSKITHFRYDYDKLFNDLFNPPKKPEEDQNLLEYLRQIVDAVCTDSMDKIMSQFSAYVKEEYCGKRNQSEPNIAELKSLDDKLLGLKAGLKRYQDRKGRLIGELSIVKKDLDQNKTELNEIESKNEKILLRSLSNPEQQTLKTITSSYLANIDEALRQKDSESDQRDKKRKELSNLEKKLSKQYLEAEEDFLPLFIENAKSFLGLDVNVSLQTYSKGASLILEVNDAERRNKHQLSESQRYFIDIALRLALSEFVSDSGTILIDTPEGSLDIAYESRAGKMFADFVKNQHGIIMTANINSSQLLIQLAKKCTSNKMKLENMTEWTFLSEVQKTEQGLIDNAFLEIQKNLN